MTAERWQQVRAIFHRAVECDPAQRIEVLRQSCGGDRQLRSEVEQLLAADGEDDTILKNPVIEAGSMAAAASAPVADAMIGLVIGNYIVDSGLARGGMGVVYRGHHLTLPRDVVVKRVRLAGFSEANREELRARFRREAHIQSQLDHPHIVRVYEFFDEAEEYFLVMEYVPGQSLRSLLNQEGVLAPGTAVALAAQALDALQHAHTLPYVDESGNNGVGIIHRDIKPANILVDEHGGLKLTDFGIAKALRGSQMTRTGMSPGTFEYMSPEQILGGSLDARSDLYSLGVTLYEMLCGSVPFRPGPTGSQYDVLKAHVETNPSPLRNLNPNISSALAAIIDRSLKKDPGERWQSAAEFRQALLTETPGSISFTPAHPDMAPASRFRARPRKIGRRMAWIAAATAVLAVAGAGLWFRRGAIQYAPRQDTASVAVLPFVDMSPEKNQQYFSDGLAEELLNGLATTPGLRVAARTSSFQFKEKSGDSRQIGKKLNAAAILEGSVRKQGNRARITVQLINASDGYHLWADTYERDMDDIFAVEEEIARAVTAALKVKLLEKNKRKAVDASAYNAFLQGRYFLQRRNQANLEKAVAYFEQAVKISPDYSRAWVGLAEARSGQAGGGYVPADQAYGQAREAANHALALDSNLGEAHAAMAWIQQFHDGDWAGAEQSYKRALELDPGDAAVIGHAGILFRIVGQLDKAVELGRRAQRIDPLSLGAHHNAGVSLYYAGLLPEAKEAFQKALELFPEMEVAHSFLGRVYLALGQPQEALAEMQQEKSQALQLFGLALANHALGRTEESDASLAELRRQFFSVAAYQVAEIYAFRGQKDKAFEALASETDFTQFKGDPLLKGLVGDPRYAALLKKARL